MTAALGFSWDRPAVVRLARDIDSHTVERVLWRYHQSLAGFVWDAAVLEGNPFTYPEVQTLMEGITVGGHKLSDERQVANLAEAARQLREMVQTERFALDKATSDLLHATIARDEALATELGGENLRELYRRGVAALGELETPFEQAAGYFLFGEP